MKKTFLFAIIFIFLLTACSPQDNGSTDIEMKLVDENLKLKEEIFDLEHELEETMEKEREEQVIESRILSFFYYINEGNREEAERRITDKIHISHNGIQSSDGRTLVSGLDGNFAMQMVQSEWDGSSRCEATLSVLKDERKQKVIVSLVKTGEEWQVDDARMVAGGRRAGTV